MHIDVEYCEWVKIANGKVSKYDNAHMCKYMYDIMEILNMKMS